MPLGVAEHGAYSQFDLPMQVGDMVLSYTDGLIESPHQGSRQLGVDGLQTVLNSLVSEQPEYVLPELLRRIAAANDGRVHGDDVTILLYRINDRPPSGRDNLLAPWRWLRGLFGGRLSTVGAGAAQRYFAFSAFPAAAERQARSITWTGRRAHWGVITSFVPRRRWSAMFR